MVTCPKGAVRQYTVGYPSDSLACCETQPYGPTTPNTGLSKCPDLGNKCAAQLPRRRLVTSCSAILLV